MQPASRHRIVRSDQSEDGLTRQRFDSYDAAYDELERYYGDFCCSDDDRVEYTNICAPPHSPDVETCEQASTSARKAFLQESSLKSQTTETHP